jgi:hypothetical protein
MSHWLSNRGKLILCQGGWDDAGATAIKLGLLAGASTPVAIDTEAEIQDLDTVAALLALTGVDEPTFAGYVRKDLSRTAAAEDDTNNRVNMDTANVTWTAAPAGDTIYGAFWYDGTVDTNDTTRLFCGLILFTPVPTNGSDLTLTVTDLVRAQ